MSQSHASYLFLIAGALISIGYGSVTPILQTQTIGSVEPHRVGLANSLFFNSMDAGMAIGAYVLGIIASGSGYQSIYAAEVVLIIVTGLQYLVLTHNKEALDIQPGLSSEITGK
ncbi:MFS transporter [Desulfosporosinus sp. SYSU MS00001]|uniref:MFS transporter n=1 Tax=Desulfosporosinus sp. SYSU MS00001 TaxID=3416284 RepID=UPI003CF16A90